MSNAREQIRLHLTNKNEKTYQKLPSVKFGENTFNEHVMREKLPKDVYKRLIKTIKAGEKLDLSIANSVAHAMKEWAISKGVTHFTHWFQPQTGLTAEKHDSFFELESDGQVIERFKGDQLVQGEPDASSFPSGGMRTTFEARGYTMWDPSSPAFIVDGPNGGGILCIPSVFISYTGEALDKKTPLLRSMEALNRAGLSLLRLFGNKTATRIVPTVGTEQEYFLIDKRFYNQRPDLQITGRTLLGAEPPKGQQLEDHYFGTIKERVLAFMQDAEHELYRLGVPAKTRHNEVAPHQFEIAPIFAELNIGADRNQIIMETLKRVADRHGLALLLHEKPFSGINGSGKHNNWSLSDSDGNNLLDPGKTPEENLQFLVFLVSVLKAVNDYGDLLRASIASAGNDHRLGANEAPPAIMSVFLGERLTQILDDIKAGKEIKRTEEFIIDLGLSKLPSILRDNTDRNRTSPFAFTGNKFEFRAVGSSASISMPNTVLSAAVADSIEIILKDIQKELEKGTEFKASVLSVLRKYIVETERIRFEGNNYSKEWEQEAEKRGLPNIKRSGYALAAWIDPKNVAMFERQKVFSKAELEARYHIKLEQYVKTLDIEAGTLCDLIKTQVIPAAFNYQTQLATAIKEVHAVASVAKNLNLEPIINTLNEVNNSISKLSEECEKLKNLLSEGQQITDIEKQARFFSDFIVDQIEKARHPADKLETLLPDELWPLPKYSEMLFML